jgi:hypothetical protein
MASAIPTSPVTQPNGDGPVKFNLRTSKKIAPGVRLNVSKKGVGASVGGKGVRVRTDKHGLSGAGGTKQERKAAEKFRVPIEKASVPELRAELASGAATVSPENRPLVMQLIHERLAQLGVDESE